MGTCVVAHCLNQLLDANETDVDCGGPDCAPCATGKSCVAHTDCVSGICQMGHCAAPPPAGIISFTANPSLVEYPSPSTLAWQTQNATTCSIDNGVGIVNCNGNVMVIPPMANTQYRLTAMNAGGAAQAVVLVGVTNCSGIAAATGACPSGATAFCEPGGVVPTSSAHARDACATCFGVACTDGTGPLGGSAWSYGNTYFYYSNATGQGSCAGVPQSGDIGGMNGCTVGRWAPGPCM
jgi:hypothetical protein